MESKSNWCIITGGPSSGKKTLLKHLGIMGFPVIWEVARGMIDRAKRQGITTEELRKDEIEFQESLLPPKLKLEQKFPRDLLAFWARAMPDSITYLINCGGDPQKARILCEPNLYWKVFLLAPLSTFTSDYARIEDVRTALELNRLLRIAYEEVDYKVIRVPEMSPIPKLSIARRLAFILAHVYGDTKRR